MSVLRVTPGRTRASVLSALRARPDVLSAEPDSVVRAAAVPTDPSFPAQWALRNVGQSPHGFPSTPGADVDALGAWDLVPSLSGVTVAVADTGVRDDHPDLAGAIVPGRDFVTTDDDTRDDNGHGTHVAGIIAASANDGGVVGLARGVKIMPVRVLDERGEGTTGTVAAGFAWAAEHGARIVNASLGGGASDAVQSVIHDHPDVLFVVAAGNAGRSISNLCTLPETNVLCVTASDEQDHLPAWAGVGTPSVDVAAPGVDIVSDALHTTTRAIDLDDASAWTLRAGWTVGGGHLHYESHGVVGDDWQDERIAELKVPLDVPVGQQCHVDYDLRASVGGFDYASGWYVTPQSGSAPPMHWGTPSSAGGISDDVSAPAGWGSATWTAQPHIALDRSPGDPADDVIDITKMRLACADATQPARADDVQELSGTSMATPAVAATAALVLASTPTARPEDLAQRIRCGVDPVTGMGDSATLSGGRLDARGALLAQLGSRPSVGVGRFATLMEGTTMPMSLAEAPDGSIVFADRNGTDDGYSGWIIKRRRADGTVQAIAGPGPAGAREIAEGTAAGAYVGQPWPLAVSPSDGTIWFVAGGATLGLWRIDPQGQLRKAYDLAADGVSTVHALYADADGTVLLAFDDGHALDHDLVVRIDRAGHRTPVAGGGTVDHPDGGAATAAHLELVQTLTRDAGGDLLIGEMFGSFTPVHQWRSTIYRVDAGGTIRPWLATRVGTEVGPIGAAPAGAWINLSRFVYAGGAAVVPEGNRLWSLSPDGVLAPFAGDGTPRGWRDGGDPDGTLAPEGHFIAIDGLAATRDGSVLVSEVAAGRIVRIGPDRTPWTLPFAPCAGGGDTPAPAPGGGDGGAPAPTTGSTPGAGTATPTTSSPTAAAGARTRPLGPVALTVGARIGRHAGRLRVVLRVTGTRGARIVLRCTGHGCPRRLPHATLGTRAATLTVSGLRAGATLELRASLAGRATRWTRVHVASARRLTRTSGCVDARGRLGRC